MSNKEKKPVGIVKGALLGGLGLGFTAIMVGQKFFPAVEKSPDKTNMVVGVGFVLGAIIGGVLAQLAAKRAAG